LSFVYDFAYVRPATTSNHGSRHVYRVSEINYLL